MACVIRQAEPGDAETIADLVRELARGEGEESPVTAEYVGSYLGFPGSAVLIAQEGARPVGMLSYSCRPGLYHAGSSVLIEELVVREGARGRGIGGALMDELVRRAAALGCAEVSVSTMPDNARAIAFYRRHGFEDEALLLEKHLD